MALEWISIDLCLSNYHNLDDSSAVLELVYKLPSCVFRERSQLNSFTEYSCSLRYKIKNKYKIGRERADGMSRKGDESATLP